VRGIHRAVVFNPRQSFVGGTARAVRRDAAIDPDALGSQLNRRRDARLAPVGGG